MISNNVKIHHLILSLSLNLWQDSFVGFRIDSKQVRLGVDLLDLVDVVAPGKVIRLRDGAIGIRVERVEGDTVVGTVLNDGTMGERKVVHFSDVTLHASPTATYQDMKTIQDFALEYGVDYVASSQASVARGRAVRSLTRDMGKCIPNRLCLNNLTTCTNSCPPSSSL